MRGPELPLILLALVLGQAPRGPAAPVPAGEGAVLAKMYPRGNHWAVGHLMGKKSTGDSRYAPEGDGTERLREYIQWEEAARSLLGLIRAQGRGDPQPQRPQPAWEVADSSDFKDAGSRCKDCQLQVLRVKEGSPHLEDNDQDSLRGAKPIT